jgi:amino acid permease
VVQDILPSHLPAFGNKGALAFFSPQSLILVSILSTGYVAHYNAPKYYFELEDHTTGRFNVVVNASFFFSALTYICISSLGFLTFGENSAGFILDNYSYRDPLATISRFGIALSVIFAYPLLFQGGRDGLWDILGQRDTSSLERRTTTVVLLTTVTLLAIFVNDLTFVLSFGGATLSSAIIYIFPPLMFQALVLNCTCLRTYRTNWEIKESEVMMWIGGAIGLCGAVVTIIRTFF